MPPAPLPGEAGCRAVGALPKKAGKPYRREREWHRGVLRRLLAGSEGGSRCAPRVPGWGGVSLS